jgi:hypothetical protein
MTLAVPVTEPALKALGAANSAGSTPDATFRASQVATSPTELNNFLDT